MLDQQQKDSYKETPEPAFAGTGVSLSTDLFYSPFFLIKNPAGSVINDEPGGNAVYIEIIYYNLFLRAPHLGMVSQTLPLQLTQPRHPHGTQELLLSAAAFLP